MAGKRYKAAAAKVVKGKPYALKEAMVLLKEGAPKFDQTVDVSINLGIDPTQSDQMVRGVVPMPHGLGKTVRVAVFAKGDKAEAAKKAGADIVGEQDLVDAITNNKPYSEVERGAMASLVTVMGRMSAHTGQLVTFDQLMAHDHEFAPGADKLTLDGPAPLIADKDGKYPIPQAGVNGMYEYAVQKA